MEILIGKEISSKSFGGASWGVTRYYATNKPGILFRTHKESDGLKSCEFIAESEVAENGKLYKWNKDIFSNIPKWELAETGVKVHLMEIPRIRTGIGSFWALEIEGKCYNKFPFEMNASPVGY